LKESKAKVGETKIVTVCDREADIYEFFKLGEELNAPLLVRAKTNRAVNKTSRYAEANTEKLWDFIIRQPVAATYTVNVTPHEKRIARVAKMELRFAPFIFNPPRNNVKHRQ
jgi:putative cell wall-binding protein